MSISYEWEDLTKMPLRCFHCKHMVALKKKEPRKYQCEYDRCKIDEDKKRAVENKGKASEGTERTT